LRRESTSFQNPEKAEDKAERNAYRQSKKRHAALINDRFNGAVRFSG
jgi:hypothetical protein